MRLSSPPLFQLGFAAMHVGLLALFGSAAPWGRFPCYVQDGFAVTTNSLESFKDWSWLCQEGEHIPATLSTLIGLQGTAKEPGV